jgi:alpha-D-xyloside xylohydrolase
MASRAPERDTLERRLVASARVLEEHARAVTLRTTSYRNPWPTGPFPPAPDPSTAIAGLLQLEAIGERAIRVRHVLGDELRDGGDSMIVGELEAPTTRVVAGSTGAELRTTRLTMTASLDPFELRLLDTGTGRQVRIGGPDRSYFGVGDSLGTGVSLDTADGRPVGTETFSIAPGTTVHGFGESFVGFDKIGQTIDLEVHDAMGVHTPRLYKPVPFFVTTAGFGVFVHTTATATAWVGSRSANEIQLAIDDDVLDYVVFAGSVREVLDDYTTLTGRAPMPPDWTFGWWQSRATYVSADETLGVVRDLRAAGFPVDVIHLDTFWFAKDWLCDLEFAPDRFPDPKGYCEELRRLGVHLSLWHLPYLPTGTRLHDRLESVEGFVTDAEGRPYDIGIHFVQDYDGPVHVIDWTNPAAVEVMREEYGRLFETGASVMKADFGEEVPTDGVFADGTPGPRMHNRYPLLYQRAVHEATEAATGERIAWVRSGWAGGQRYPVHWGGDAPGDWEMLQAELHGGLSLGLSGYTFWSSDIGGTGELPEEELLIRWLQLGVLLSHARVHGDGIREAHRWSPVASDLARGWIGLRYRLLPYLLGSARAAAEAGLPFARPLLLDFQDDPTTWTIGDEFLCGEALLVAPILEPGGRRRVYLPRVRWYEWSAGEAAGGGSWVDVEHELASLPMYLREGAVVPMGPEMAHFGERPTDPLTVRVAPFSGHGETVFRTTLDGRPVALRYRAVGGRHELLVRGAPGAIEVDAVDGTRIELVVDGG